MLSKFVCFMKLGPAWKFNLEVVWLYFYSESTGAVSDAFIDIKDAQWLLAHDIIPLDINSITPSQFVIYRFGVFIVRLLKETIGTPNVTLLLASSLPQNDYDRNMYRRSFFYQRAMNILFIRRERLESVGEFVMLIMHCLAHIKTGELKDDADPLFLRAFYKVKLVFGFCLFTRTPMFRSTIFPYFLEFSEQKSQAYYSNGICTDNLCNSRVDVSPRDCPVARAKAWRVPSWCHKVKNLCMQINHFLNTQLCLTLPAYCGTF